MESCVVLRVPPLGVKTAAWFGSSVLGAGSKLLAACRERELVNEGAMWSKSLKNAAEASDPG